MTKTITIINSNSLNNNEVNEQEKDYKTFSVQDQVIISSYHHKNNGLRAEVEKSIQTYL